jgi:hypothetical protein
MAFCRRFLSLTSRRICFSVAGTERGLSGYSCSARSRGIDLMGARPSRTAVSYISRSRSFRSRLGCLPFFHGALAASANKRRASGRPRCVTAVLNRSVARCSIVAILARLSSTLSASREGGQTASPKRSRSSHRGHSEEKAGAAAIRRYRMNGENRRPSNAPLRLLQKSRL